MGCLCGLAAGVIRYLMFAANILFMVSGIAIISLGSVILSNFDDYDDILDGSFTATAISIIVVGSLICVIGFCGCCGAIRKNVCLLNTYSILLLCVFIAEIAIGIVALIQVGNTQTYLQDNMYRIFTEEYADGSSEVFDEIQKKFECCGVNSPGDFATIVQPFPESCKCSVVSNICNGTIYSSGCINEFTTWLEDGTRTVGIVSLCVAACEVIAIVLACCLAARFKKQGGH